jgi:hypothetical protein
MIKEHIDLVTVALVSLSIIMYDVVFDLFLNILHLAFEFIHIMYEWFELGIEHTVEHLFHTSRHGSQVVTFYILILIAILLIYWLWQVLPRLYKRFIQFVHQAWERRKTECQSYWVSLTLSNKLSLFSTVGIVCLTYFFVM